jgi:hypothetical protein
MGSIQKPRFFCFFSELVLTAILAGGRARLTFCHVATPQQTVCQPIFGMIFYFENLCDFFLMSVDNDCR